MVNLMTRTDSLETLCNVIILVKILWSNNFGHCLKVDPLYGDFMVKLVWRLSGVFMKKAW